MNEHTYNVVYIADIPQTRGAASSLFDLVKGMRDKYDTNCTVLFPTNGELKSRFTDIGINTYVTGHRDFLIPSTDTRVLQIPHFVVETGLYFSSKRRAFKKAIELIDFSNIDIIHSNTPRTDLGIELSRAFKIPHITHLREFSFEDFHCRSYRRNVGRYLSDESDKLIAVSHACANAWIERGVDKDKVQVIYNGINLDNYLKARNCSGPKLSDEREDLHILFLGGCNTSKGLSDAVEAFGLLCESTRQHVHLDVYGWSSLLYKQQVLQRIAELNLDNNIHINGVCNCVYDLMPKYDIGLVCSHSEAFGRVVIEYQASGLAVVGPNTGSIPELLDYGTKGRIYDKKDGALSLAKVIEGLFQNRQELNFLMQNGRQFAKYYNVDRVINECYTIYSNIYK